MWESSPQPGGGTVTWRKETGRKATGRKETGAQYKQERVDLLITYDI